MNIENFPKLLKCNRRNNKIIKTLVSKIRMPRDCNTHIGNYIGSVTPLLFYYTIETRG